MKRIYLLLFILIACGVQTFAQRSVNLEARPEFIGTTKAGKHQIVNGEKLLYDGDGKSSYWFTWIVKNLGPVDTLKTGDSLFIMRAFNGTTPIRYVFPANSGLGVGDSIGIIPVDASQQEAATVLQPNSNITTSGTVSNIQWCDSIWVKNGGTVIDPIVGNDKSCHTVEITFWLTGINTVTNLADGFLIFPNPATDKLNMKFDFGTGAKNVSIALRDVVGKTVYYNELGNVSGNQERTIDVTNLPKGMYVAEMSFNGEKIVSKVSLQ